MTDLQVLIVGAGPVGLTLANELARLGVGIRIIDRAIGPSEHSRALVVHCRTQELLRESGLRQLIAAKAIDVRGMRFARGHRFMGRIPFDLGAYPALSLPQNRTEEVLRAALAGRGVQVEWQSQLTELRQDSTGVEALVGSQSVRASYVVGCDGAHSEVRHQLGVAFEGESLPETLWMADAVLDWDVAPDHVWQFMHADGALSSIPMPGGSWRLVAMTSDSSREPTKAFFEAAVERTTGRCASIEIASMSAFRVNCRLASGYGKGRVYLAGDAAHIHSPIGGQGMNVGMQDAISLAAKLAAAVRTRAAEFLEAYERERRPVAAAVIRANGRITKLAMSNRPVQRLIRDRVIPNILRFAPIARRAGLQASGLI